MATTVRSRKAKGRKLQSDIAEQIRRYFLLEERDVVSCPSSVTGMDILLSEKAKMMFPYAVEAKNTETASIWAWMKQAESNVEPGLTPIVVFKRNRSDTFCCLKFDDFLKITSELDHYKDKVLNHV